MPGPTVQMVYNALPPEMRNVLMTVQRYSECIADGQDECAVEELRNLLDGARRLEAWERRMDKRDETDARVTGKVNARMGKVRHLRVMREDG